MRYLRVFRPWIYLLLGAASASAQAVISTHAGTINFSEGEVYVDDQPLTQKAATFPSIKDGSTLRTGKGRAEVLLQPSVYLRVDENSAIRMVSNDLAKTRIAFVKGAVILDSNDQPAGTSLVLVYRTYQFRFLKPGVYRLNSEPGILETYSGEAEVTADGQQTKKIDDSHEFFLDIGMLTPKYGDGTMDAFSEWARKRSDTIAAANRAQQGVTDPADSTADPGFDAGAGLPGVTPGYGGGYSAPGPAYGGVSPGYGGYGGLNAPIVIGPPIYPGLGMMGLYGSAWGTPFLIPTAMIYVIPAYYHRYPTSNGWHHHSPYPTLSPSESALQYLHSGAGLHSGTSLSSPMLGLRTPRVNVGVPHYVVPRYATPHYTGPRYAAPHYSAPAVAPHVMIHR